MDAPPEPVVIEAPSPTQIGGYGQLDANYLRVGAGNPWEGSATVRRLVLFVSHDLSRWGLPIDTAVELEWENAIMGWIRTRPALCVGLSALDWRHRMLLRWLFDQRPPPAGSVVVLAEAQAEDEIWEKHGAGIPSGGNFSVVRQPTGVLVDLLRGAKP